MFLQILDRNWQMRRFGGNETFRPISEVKLLWEELNHEPCDLILL